MTISVSWNDQSKTFLYIQFPESYCWNQLENVLHFGLSQINLVAHPVNLIVDLSLCGASRSFEPLLWNKVLKYASDNLKSIIFVDTNPSTVECIKTFLKVNANHHISIHICDSLTDAYLLDDCLKHRNITMSNTAQQLSSAIVAS